MHSLFLAEDPAFSGAVVACDQFSDQLLRQQTSTQIPAFSAYSAHNTSTDTSNYADIFSQTAIALALGSGSDESLAAIQATIAAAKAADVYLTASLSSMPRQALALDSIQDAIARHAATDADLCLFALHDTSENARTDASPEQSVVAAMGGVAWPFLAKHSIVCLCISDLKLALEQSDFVLCWTSKGSDRNSAIGAGCREIVELSSLLKRATVCGVVALPVGSSVKMADVDYALGQVKTIKEIEEDVPVLVGSLYEKEPTSFNESVLFYVGFRNQIAND